MYKRRLDQKGVVIPDTIEKHKVGPELDDKLKHKNDTECGSCYGAAPEDECCNTCDEVRMHKRSSIGQLLDTQPIAVHHFNAHACLCMTIAADLHSACYL